MWPRELAQFSWRGVNTSLGGLNFYDNILGEFTAEDIVSLGLDSKGDTTQGSNAVIITANTVVTADITVGIVILENTGVVNNNCVKGNDQHE